jgi:hypothetical protein
MEFGACEVCNNGTSGADVVAAFISRLHPDQDEQSWQAKDIKSLIPRSTHSLPASGTRWTSREVIKKGGYADRTRACCGGSSMSTPMGPGSVSVRGL